MGDGAAVVRADWLAFDSIWAVPPTVRFNKPHAPLFFSKPNELAKEFCPVSNIRFKQNGSIMCPYQQQSPLC
jgi:hypothetical protein